MNAKARAARSTLRQRTRQTRAAATIRRRGDASLTTHAIAAGLPLREARTVAGSLRNNAKALGIDGREVTLRVKWRTHSRKTAEVTAHRYTPAQVALAAAAYRPRKAEYRTARAYLLAA